jgi:osmotically-inducible protein OsmY
MKSDSNLKKDVLDELLWDPLVPEERVGVSVSAGVVTLTGHLDSYAEKVAARRAAQRVSGVKALAVELDVVPLVDHVRSDTEIATAVENALAWNTSVPQDRVQVVVEKGWVTLSGELDWNFQRRAVERVIRPLKGVKGIMDNIELKALPVATDLSMRIQEALTRQVVREARRIEINVEGGTVTLRGRVHSWAESNAAEGVTWSAPGVNRVQNLLTVQRSQYRCERITRWYRNTSCRDTSPQWGHFSRILPTMTASSETKPAFARSPSTTSSGLSSTNENRGTPPVRKPDRPDCKAS